MNTTQMPSTHHNPLPCISAEQLQAGIAAGRRERSAMFHQILAAVIASTRKAWHIQDLPGSGQVNGARGLQTAGVCQAQ